MDCEKCKWNAGEKERSYICELCNDGELWEEDES